MCGSAAAAYRCFERRWIVGLRPVPRDNEARRFSSIGRAMQVRYGGQRCAPVSNRACIDRRGQSEIVSQLLRHCLANVFKRFRFVRPARADHRGEHTLIAAIERATVENPLRVTALRRIIEQRSEATRDANGWRVLQVDGVDRLVLEASHRFVRRVQSIAAPHDVLKVGRGGRVDDRVDLDGSLGLVPQLKMKRTRYARCGRLAQPAHHGELHRRVPRRTFDRIGKQRRKISARQPHFAGRAAQRRANRAARWRRFAPRLDREAC